MVAVTSSATSTTTMRVPTVLIGSSRCTLRLSMRMPRASRIASTMSCVVTEPKRRPSSPAWWVIVSTVLFRSSAFSRAFEVASSSALSACTWRRCAAAIEPFVAGSASLRGIR
jgi:hypothetical protein